VGEYGSVAAVISVLAVALAGLTAKIATLPATPTSARALVVQAARQEGVEAAVAKKAYADAPYTRADLKALYAIAFVTARGPKNTCVRELAFGPPTVESIEQGLRRDKGMVERLRKAKVPPAVAAKAVQRGEIAGCT
jgi:hypothetical protein